MAPKTRMRIILTSTGLSLFSWKNVPARPIKDRKVISRPILSKKSRDLSTPDRLQISFKRMSGGGCLLERQGSWNICQTSLVLSLEKLNAGLADVILVLTELSLAGFSFLLLSWSRARLRKKEKRAEGERRLTGSRKRMRKIMKEISCRSKGVRLHPFLSLKTSSRP